MINLAEYPISLFPGMEICQLIVEQVSSDAVLESQRLPRPKHSDRYLGTTRFLESGGRPPHSESYPCTPGASRPVRVARDVLFARAGLPDEPLQVDHVAGLQILDRFF